MRTRLILLFVFSGILQGLHAQYSDPDYSDDDFFLEDSSALDPIETLNLFGTGAPTRYKSLKAFLPPVLNLMDNRTPPGSAVIWAFTYQAMAIQYRSELRQTPDFSYSYVFNQMTKNKDCRFTRGSINELSGLLKTTGTVLVRDFNKPAQCGTVNTPAPSKKHYKLKDLYSVFDSQCNEKDPDCIPARLLHNKLSRIKIVLLQNKPVVALLKVHANFHLLNREYIEYHKDQPLYSGSKTIVIIGFDEAKQAFEVTFPAGKSWGKNGIALLKYSDLVYVTKAYSLVLDKRTQSIAQTQDTPASNATASNTPAASSASKVNSTTPKVNPPKPPQAPQPTEDQKMRADISINEIRIGSDHQVAAQPFTLHISDKIVGLQAPLSPEQYYQISIRNVSEDSYFYVLNIEKEKKQVHFPINKVLSTQPPETRPVSSYVISGSADFYVPRPRTDPATGNLILRGFVKKDPEKEYMVLLFSKEKIDGEIRNLIDRLVYLPDSNHFYRQLCDELGDKLTLPELKTANAGNRIKLNSFSSKGSILPAVISIRGQ